MKKEILPYISIALTLLGFILLLVGFVVIGMLILSISLLLPAILFFQTRFWVDPSTNNAQSFEKRLYDGEWYCEGKRVIP